MTAVEISQVRRFNRLVTARVGALEETYLDRGRPLAEARLLFEIGPSGTDLRAVRERLKLDSGYASRLVRSLEGQGLVTVEVGRDDGRRRELRLTAAGRAEYQAYEQLSDDLATSMLAGLDADERQRLLAAMREVERLIHAGQIEVRVEHPASAAARRCLTSYLQELGQRFDTGFDPARSISAREDELMPPAGVFLVAWVEGEPAGCGALKFGDGVTGEVKRMWTAPHARGRGIASRILQFLEEQARQRGLTRLRLETNRALTEAHALYRKRGYVEVAAFSDEPYAHHWFEKGL